MLWIWLMIVVFLILIELTTKKLITNCFVASSIVTLALSIVIKTYLTQFIIFIVLGLGLFKLSQNPSILKRIFNEE